MKTILALTTAGIAAASLQCDGRKKSCETQVLTQETTQVYAITDKDNTKKVLMVTRDTVSKPYTCVTLYADTVSKPR